MMAHADALRVRAGRRAARPDRSLSRVLHQQAVDESSLARQPRTWTSWPCGCRAAAPASTWRWCAAAATWATAPYFPTHVDDAAAVAEGHRARGARCWRPSSPSTTSTARAAAAGDQPCGRARADRGAGQHSGVQGQRRCTSRASSAASGSRWRARRRASRWRGCWPKKARSANARARWPRRSTSRGRPGRAAHRVFRHQPHRGRGHAGQLRGVREPPDAERAVPPLQHRRHHRRRRLRRHAPGADAPLRQAGRGAGQPAATARAPARPGAGRRRPRPGGDGARGVRRTRAGPVADRRRREGRGPQGRAGGTGVRRRPRQGVRWATIRPR